jgi:uncharacterized protein (DUF697 family)
MPEPAGPGAEPPAPESTPATASAQPAARPRRPGTTKGGARSARAAAESAAPEPPVRDPSPETIPVQDGPVVATGEIVDKDMITPIERAEALAKRRAEAERIITRHAAWSTAGSLIPLPVVDVAAVSATQLRMVMELARLHGVPFSADGVKAVVGAVVGGVTPYAVSAGAVSLLFKSLPGAGLVAGLAGMAGLSNLSTRVLGGLFARHFEAGGTLDRGELKALRLGYAEAMSREKGAGSSASVISIATAARQPTGAPTS